MSFGIQEQMNRLLQEQVREAGYEVGLVCTDEGLLVAASDEEIGAEELAGLVSLFDDIVLRARRDLSMGRIDEVTMLDPDRGRLVVRPLLLSGRQRFFLVVRLPTRATWRRTTNLLGRRLAGLLAPLSQEA
jgi:hypothetical protein